MGDSSEGIKARLVMQQCLSARLQVQPPSEGVQAQYVEIKRGVIAYICFMKGADKTTVEKMSKMITSIRLSSLDGKMVSVQDLPGDVLLVPQATLGGKAKGKMMQYHSNIAKNDGLELYGELVSQCCKVIENNAKCKDIGKKVECGTYGNIQVLNVETNGPYTHYFEF